MGRPQPPTPRLATRARRKKTKYTVSISILLVGIAHLHRLGGRGNDGWNSSGAEPILLESFDCGDGGSSRAADLILQNTCFLLRGEGAEVHTGYGGGGTCTTDATLLTKEWKCIIQ